MKTLKSTRTRKTIMKIVISRLLYLIPLNTGIPHTSQITPTLLKIELKRNLPPPRMRNKFIEEKVKRKSLIGKDQKKEIQRGKRRKKRKLVTTRKKNLANTRVLRRKETQGIIAELKRTRQVRSHHQSHAATIVPSLPKMLKKKKLTSTIPNTGKGPRSNLRVPPVAVQESYLKTAVIVDLKVIKATNKPAQMIYPVLICLKILLKIVIKKPDLRKEPQTAITEKKRQPVRKAEWNPRGNLLLDCLA